jgi:hypothetical protein
MATGNARYANVPAFAPGPDGSLPFPGLRPRPIGPATPVVEHTIRAADRHDLTVRYYHEDDRLWWRLVDANPEFLVGRDLFADCLGGVLVLDPSEEPVTSQIGRVVLVPRAGG